MTTVKDFFSIFNLECDIVKWNNCLNLGITESNLCGLKSRKYGITLLPLKLGERKNPNYLKEKKNGNWIVPAL